jgi:hypothetical protein
VILNEKFVLNSITSIPDPNWLVGFVAGESSFSANINSKTDQIRARFFITQHSRDLNLLKIIKLYLGDLGGIYKISKSAYNYEVSSYKSCFENIIPFFIKNPLPSVCLKSSNFLIWKEIIEIMISKEHLTSKKSYVKSLINKLNKYE